MKVNLDGTLGDALDDLGDLLLVVAQQLRAIEGGGNVQVQGVLFEPLEPRGLQPRLIVGFVDARLVAELAQRFLPQLVCFHDAGF
jgi:hypothetical protein